MSERPISVDDGMTLLESLARVRALVERATRGELVTEFGSPHESDLVTIALVGDWRVGVHTGVKGGNYRDHPFGSDETDAAMLAAAVNLIREHGAEIERIVRERE